MQDHYFPYPGWQINLKNSEAIRRVNNELIKIRLFKAGELLEGWWPSIPQDKRTLMITGICLWDARWQVEFEHVNKRNPPARRSLTLPLEREDAIKRIRNGARVVRIYYPLNFRVYHQATIAWQLRKIVQFNPKQIAYHLPTKEYHDYVSALEENLGMSLSSLHESLDSFVQTLINYINAEADDEIRKKINFIVPYDKGATHPYESYSFPYKFPEKFGIDKEEAFGIEHLAEVSAAYTAWKQSGGDPIPVLVVVMRDDYYNKKLIDTDCLNIL